MDAYKIGFRVLLETTPLAHTTDPALIDKLWLWERRDAATPIEVPNPSEYNLIFNADGTFFAQLDCNRGGGSYATPGDGSLMMELGMTSMALCPEDSLINEMMATFPAAAQYRIGKFAHAGRWGDRINRDHFGHAEGHVGDGFVAVDGEHFMHDVSW